MPAGRLSVFSAAGSALILAAGLLAGTASAAESTGAVIPDPVIEDWIIADNIAASSTLEDYSGFDYSTRCLQDFNRNTAWVEGVDGSGTGESLVFSFPEETVLTGGVIYNGYQKSESLLHANGAPAAFRIESGAFRTELFLDSYADRFLDESEEGYLFRFEEPLVPDQGQVTATITAVREGSLYSDTCVSEFRFLGYRPRALSLTQNELAELGSFSQRICNIYMGNSWYEGTIRAEDLTAEQQAWLLYWYQYNITDGRILTDASGQWHTASKQDLLKIVGEMFGEYQKSDTLSVFLDQFADHEEDSLVFMGAVGDFGDAGPYYFDPPSDYRVEDGLVCVQGAVMEWNNNANCYLHRNMYTGYFRASHSEKGSKTVFCPDHITIGF